MWKKQKTQTSDSKNKAPTLSKGICISLNVSLGVRRAVSNSSAENSTEIFKRGLNTCSNKVQQIRKPQNTTYIITPSTQSNSEDHSFPAHMQEIEYGSQLPHGPQVPPGQLRRWGRFHKRRHDLAALLLLLLLRRVLPPPLLLRSFSPPLDRRLRCRIETRSSANGTRAGRAFAPRSSRSGAGAGGGFLLRSGNDVVVVLRIGFRQGSVGGLSRDQRRRSLGHSYRDQNSKGFRGSYGGITYGKDHGLALEREIKVKGIC